MGPISWQDRENAWNGIHQTTLSETMDARGWSSKGTKRVKMSLTSSQGPDGDRRAVVDVWDDVWRAQTWGMFQWNATLTRIELFADTVPRLAENTRRQERGNCGRFWCAYNFKVVGQIPTGTDLRGMYGIGLTCGVANALKQEGFQDLGIRRQSLGSRIIYDIKTSRKNMIKKTAIVTFTKT